MVMRSSHTCTQTHTHTHTRTHINMHTHVHTYVHTHCPCTYMYVCMYVCMQLSDILVLVQPQLVVEPEEASIKHEIQKHWDLQLV